MLRLPTFTYHRPKTATEAVAIASAHGKAAMYVAGGTDLYPNMKRRQQTPTQVVSLQDVRELHAIEVHKDGSVTIGDAGSPRGAAARRLLGLAPQKIALYEDLTGRENLAFLARIHGVAHPVRRADELLDLVGLLPRARDRVGTYSGGMQRRLNLAAALVHDPPALFLDEPTAGVDPQSRSGIIEVVRALAARGCAVVYTTHYMEEAERICSRVAIVDHGRVLATGAVPELLAAHGRDLETVFLALTGRSLRD